MTQDMQDVRPSFANTVSTMRVRVNCAAQISAHLSRIAREIRNAPRAAMRRRRKPIAFVRRTLLQHNTIEKSFL
jgi:hypothetical protein